MGGKTSNPKAWLFVLPVVLLACWGMYFLGEKQCNDLLRRMSRARRMVTP